MRRIVLISGWTLVWSGMIILSYVGYTLYGTGLETSRSQDQAREELADVLAAAPTTTAPPGSVPGGDDPSPPPISTEEPTTEGEPFGLIRMPSIEVDQVIFEGVQVETLRKGPGHIPGSPLPGQPGNSVISGHRTTYGQPFFDLDLLKTGDTIFVDTEIGTHEYEVRESKIVDPSDVSVLDDRGGAWLTLTTCHPKFSARQRLIIFAEMVAGPNAQAVAAL